MTISITTSVDPRRQSMPSAESPAPANSARAWVRGEQPSPMRRIDGAAFGGRGGVARWAEMESNVRTLFDRWSYSDRQSGIYSDPLARPPISIELVTGSANELHLGVWRDGVHSYVVMKQSPDGSEVRVILDGTVVRPSDSRERLIEAAEVARLAVRI